MYFYYIILNIIFFSQFIKCYNRKIELASSYIFLKVIGNGNINIYNQDFCGPKPNIVSINNIINLTDSQTNYHYNFVNSENDVNNITLIWNISLTTTNYLFSICRNIIEMDLSYFDLSQVKDTDEMFYECSKLISLNLSNINTPSICSMLRMFSGCSSLISLDLSYFDTSKVGVMLEMFQGCSNLISLNLSNFNASSLTTMVDMFDGCNKLKYINLIHAKINPNKISSSIWSNPPSNLFICTEDEDWPKIFSLSDKQYVNCINNIINYNINRKESIIRCYKNNIESDNPCQMCGNDYFNISGIINNTYINCYIETSFYFNINSEIIEIENEIKNKTELIQNSINNLFNKLNISYIDNGEDEINDIKNISIIIT